MSRKKPNRAERRATATSFTEPAAPKVEASHWERPEPTPEMQKWLTLAVASLVFGVLIGLIGFLIIPDRLFKTIFMIVGVFDLLAATFFMAKAFRAK